MDRVPIMDKSSRYRLGLYEKAMPSGLSWVEKLSMTKEAGFDFLEISIDETDEKLARLQYTKEQVQEIIDAMYKTQCTIRTMCLSGHRKYPLGANDPQVRHRSLRIMEQAIDLADALGIRMIQLAGYDVYYEESSKQTRAWFMENLQLCVAMAAKKGIMLGFETMETAFMDTVAKAMVYVDQIHSPYLGIYPDIGNLTNAALLYQTNVLDDIALGHGHIIAAHLKETVPGVYREVPFGTGHTNFQGCIKQLYGQGVCLFTGEFWYTGSAVWQQDLKDANLFLRKQIALAINSDLD